jgi:hypothetical protein
VTRRASKLLSQVLNKPPGTDGWARLAHGTIAAPSASFVLRLTSPVLGMIELAAAPPEPDHGGRARHSPDGHLDVLQHILRVPGRHYSQEPEPGGPQS